jgi:protein-S-isoprenylcysteine O-methyltransferase Ste14
MTFAAGAMLITWALAAHLEAAPRGWALESWPTREYLLRRGPYALSRNPMYLGDAVVWLGWALFYGNRRAVWIGLGLLCAAFATVCAGRSGGCWPASARSTELT